MILRLWIIILINISVNASAQFGQECAPKGTSVQSTDLGNIASFLINNIDVTNFNSCLPNSDTNDTFTFCVRKNSANTEINGKAELLNTSGETPVNCDKIDVNLNDALSGNYISLKSATNNDINQLDIQMYLKQIEGLICLGFDNTQGFTKLFCKYDPSQQITLAGVNNSSSASCSTVSKACSSTNPNNYSRYNKNFSGKVIQCMSETLNNIFIKPPRCQYNNNVSKIYATYTSESLAMTPFTAFQGLLKKSIYAAITIYITFYGMNLVISQVQEGAMNDAFLSVLKILLVIYFSVGLNDPRSGQLENGVVTLILPTLLQYMNEFSTFMINQLTSSNNLCYFNPNDYLPGYKYYALWDTIDCRLNIFLGRGEIFGDAPSDYSISGGSFGAATGWLEEVNNAVNGLNNKATALHSSISANTTITTIRVIFCLLMVPIFILPGILLCVTIIFIIGLTFNIITNFIISLLLLYILVYISPIFITFSLFNKTKTFYTNWQNLLLGTAFKPVIIVAFSAMLFSLVDLAFFSTCVFDKYEKTSSPIDTMFKIKLPSNNQFIGNGSFNSVVDMQNACRNSPGYMIFNLITKPSSFVETNNGLITFVSFVAPGQSFNNSILASFMIIFVVMILARKTDNIAEELSGSFATGGLTAGANGIANFTAGKMKSIQGSYKGAKADITKQNNEKARKKREGAG